MMAVNDCISDGEGGLKSRVPELTVENVFPILQEVPLNWDKLIDSLLGGLQKHILGECDEYKSREEYYRKAVDAFCQGNGLYPQSWRLLIRALEDNNEATVADKLKKYAEPLQDETLTFENVLAVMEKTVGGWKEVLHLAHCQTKDIEKKFLSDKERVEAGIHIFLAYHPFCSWQLLSGHLFEAEELAALEMSKHYYNTLDDSSLNFTNLNTVINEVSTNWREFWKEDNVVWGDPTHGLLGGISSTALDKIQTTCSTNEESMVKSTEHFLKYHPDPTWERVVRALVVKGETAALNKALKFIQEEPTLSKERLIEALDEVKTKKQLWQFCGYSGVWDDQARAIVSATSEGIQEMKESIVDHITTNRRHISWEKIADALKTIGMTARANYVITKYVNVSKDADQQFTVAMKIGHVVCENANVYISGAAGVGKSTFLDRLLGRTSPSIRISTPCAKKPIRTIARTKLGVQSTKLKEITQDDLAEMIACTAKDIAEGISKDASSKCHGTTPSQEISEFTKISPTIFSVQNEPQANKEAIPINTRKGMARRHGLEYELLRRLHAGPKRLSLKLFNQRFLNVIDSGGQPQFHEILPLFIDNTALGIFIVKLSESLEEHPLVEYYDVKGNRIGKPYQSTLSHKQIIKHCLQAVKSQTSKSEGTKFVFVGTHRDLEYKCTTETRKEKNEKLRQMLVEADMESKVIFVSQDLVDILFSINAKDPSNEDEDVIEGLEREILSSLRVPSVEIPLQWFCLELAIQRLVQGSEVSRRVFSRNEIFKVAAPFFFTEESFASALLYLHRHKFLFYYENILPQVVFADAQVLLTKISELVEYVFQLRFNPSQQATDGAVKEFRDRGIITLEILKKFPSHYFPDLFMHEDLIKVYEHLRILAAIDTNEYLVPCLLQVNTEEILTSMSSENAVPLLLFEFPDGGPMLGIFCQLITYLLTTAKWRLMKLANRPARNCVQFVMPGNYPGSVTVTDSFSTYFKVSIQVDTLIADEVCEEICPEIQETVFCGIIESSQRLGYGKSLPQVAFICCSNKHSEQVTQSSSTSHSTCKKHDPVSILSAHSANISKNGKLMTCSKQNSVYEILSEKHKVWFKDRIIPAPPAKNTDSIQSTAKPPPQASKKECGLTLKNLDLLKWKTADGKKEKISILRAVMNSWKRIGHRVGVEYQTLEAWETTYHRNPEDCCRSVFQHWLNYGCEDYDVGWEGILELLDDLDFKQDALKLQQALKNQ